MKPIAKSSNGTRSRAGLERIGKSQLTRAEQPARRFANSPDVISPHVSAWVAMYAKRSRFNPIRQLTPEYLARTIDAFQNGYLREFALMADAIKHRDPIIQVCLRKREKGVARHGIKVIIKDGLPEELKAEADRHQAALQYFYDNCHAKHVLEQDQVGGARLLIKQMMEAQYYRYAVHEIVWRPSIDAITGEPRLTADFNFVPLWFFESTVGHLRFIRRYFGSIMGDELEPGQWLVTVGDGMAEALACAFMMKRLASNDWLSFSERFGTPGLLGKTKAAKDSPGWKQMEADLAVFAQGWTAVTNADNSVELVQATGATGANTTFEAFIQYLDKAIATLVRGADLSTISSGKQTQGRGASLQGDETELLEQDDAVLITETLHKVDEQIVSQLFGTNVPLAEARVVVPDVKIVADTIAKLTYLVSAGVAVGQDYARNELGVPKPAEDEDLLKAVVPPSPFGGGDPGQQDGQPGAFGKKKPPRAKGAAADEEDPAAVANVARGVTPALARHDAQMAGRLAVFRANALDLLHRGQRTALQPLIDQIANIAGMGDQTQFEAALTKLKAELPRWYRRLAADPALANALEQIYGSCLVSKAAEAAAARTGAVAVKEAATA